MVLNSRRVDILHLRVNFRILYSTQEHIALTLKFIRSNTLRGALILRWFDVVHILFYKMLISSFRWILSIRAGPNWSAWPTATGAWATSARWRDLSFLFHFFNGSFTSVKPWIYYNTAAWHAYAVMNFLINCQKSCQLTPGRSSWISLES